MFRPYGLGLLLPVVVIFGATWSDQVQGVSTIQAVDGVSYQHSAFAVGFWDPTLEVDTQATHGFMAVGEPMVVTAAPANSGPILAALVRRMNAGEAA